MAWCSGVGQWIARCSVALVAGGLVLLAGIPTSAAALPTGSGTPQQTSSAAAIWPARIRPAADTAPSQPTTAAPLAALQTATLNPARALRATDSLGTVQVGKVTDLVLLDADIAPH